MKIKQCRSKKYPERACGSVKPVKQFEGRHTLCRNCSAPWKSISDKTRYEKIKEEPKEIDRKLKYREENKEELNEYCRQYREKNRERLVDLDRAYYVENREERLQQAKKYHHAHKEEKNLYSRKYAKEHKDERREYHLKKYGLTLEDYNRMFEQQHGLCAICFGGEALGKYDRLFVDHNHTTGQVRGLVCNPCNIILGYARDNIIILDRAKEYLLSRDDNALNIAYGGVFSANG